MIILFKLGLIGKIIRYKYNKSMIYMCLVSIELCLQGGKAKKSDELNQVRGKKNRKKKKKKTTELKNFYAHQIKDEKINHIKELRQKFEEDKAKVAKMKADRKFRPF